MLKVPSTACTSLVVSLESQAISLLSPAQASHTLSNLSHDMFADRNGASHEQALRPKRAGKTGCALIWSSPWENGRSLTFGFQGAYLGLRSGPSQLVESSEQSPSTALMSLFFPFRLKQPFN